MSVEKAEHERELWRNWKADPAPYTLGAVMDSLKPVIKSEANKWKQTNINPTLLEGHAQELAYEAMHTYDPTKSQLNTHVTNHLQKMNRYVIENQQAVRVQEAKVFEYRKYNREVDNLSNELGRDPTKADLAQHFAHAGKIADYKPVMEHFYSKNVETGGSAPVMEELSMHATAMAMMYDNLNSREKQIFEKAYGYNGVKVVPKKDIAKSLGISAAAISKQLRKIEKVYQDHVTAANAMSSGFDKSGSNLFQNENKERLGHLNLQKIQWNFRPDQNQQL